MSEQLYKEAAEYFFNHILRRPNWDDATWETMKAAHEANGFTIARAAWDIGELVENEGFTINQVLDHLKKERQRTDQGDPFRDRPNSFYV